MTETRDIFTTERSRLQAEGVSVDTYTEDKAWAVFDEQAEKAQQHPKYTADAFAEQAPKAARLCLLQSVLLTNEAKKRVWEDSR